MRNVIDMIAVERHGKSGVRKEMLVWPMANCGLCDRLS